MGVRGSTDVSTANRTDHILAIGTLGVAQGSEKGILSFKQQSHSCKEWNILPKKKRPKAKINTISGVNSFFYDARSK